jgi:hypothetical protein
MFPDIPQYGHPPCVRVRSCDLLSFAVPISTTIFSARVQSNSQPTRSSSAGSLIPYAPPPVLSHRPLRTHLLQPPEAYFTLYPRPSNANGTPPAGAPTTAHTATAVAPHIRSKETLISRFGLESRLSATNVASSPEQDAGGRAVWEDTAEKREASLRERKARMVLAARQYVQSSFLAYHRKLTGRSPW